MLSVFKQSKMSRAYTTPIQYGPNGCQVNIDGSQTCRETQTLEIIKEFNRVYESKLQELGSIGGGDNLLAKLHLQQDWIRDLTQQNEMLVKAVEELEKDAAERVSMLEERLQNGAQVTQEAKALDNKLKDMERRLSQSPTESDVQELSFKLRLKDEELSSFKRKVEAECRNADEVIKCKDNKIKELVWQINCLKQKIIKLEDKKAVQETLKPVPPKPVSPKLRKRVSNRNKQSNNYSSICTCDKPIVIKQNEVEVSRENYPKRDCSKLCSRNDSIPPLLHTELDHVENAEVDSSPKKEIVSSWPPTNKPSHLQYLCLYEGDVRENDRNALKGNVAHNNFESNFLFTSENCFYSSNTHRIDAGKSNIKRVSQMGCCLSAQKILHEYYGISDSSGSYGVIKNFQEVAEVNIANTSKRIPIKTYINNLELNIKKSAGACIGIKKKVQSSTKSKKITLDSDHIYR